MLGNGFPTVTVRQAGDYATSGLGAPPNPSPPTSTTIFIGASSGAVTPPYSAQFVPTALYSGGTIIGTGTLATRSMGGEPYWYPVCQGGGNGWA